MQDAFSHSAIAVSSFEFTEGDRFWNRLKELSVSNEPALIGGGDGTICRAAELYMKSKGAFGILPFGTMNMLARDLKIPVELTEMARAYENTETTSIDVGLINNKPFFCAAALGVMPEASQLREQTRTVPAALSMPLLGMFVFQELDKAKRRKILITIDDRRFRTKVSSLVISNNEFTTNSDQDNGFQRQSLRDGVLGVYAARPMTVWARVRLLMNLRSGAWGNDPAIHHYKGQAITIHTTRPHELISIDGEPLEMSSPLEFKILPKALKVIIPKI